MHQLFGWRSLLPWILHRKWDIFPKNARIKKGVEKEMKEEEKVPAPVFLSHSSNKKKKKTKWA